MILQALYEYYLRHDGLAPQGYELRHIPFVIVLDPDGAFFDLEDARGGTFGRSAQVPKLPLRSGTAGWKKCGLFWDHSGFVLGHPGNGRPEMLPVARRQNETFRAAIVRLAEVFPGNREFRAVARFYESPDFAAAVFAHPVWPLCAEIPGCYLSFRIRGGDRLVAEHPDLAGHAVPAGHTNLQGVCLVTGARGPVALLHTPTPLPGGKKTAKLVGFQIRAGYDSYGKRQGMNAPVCPAAEAGYATALNRLLGKQSSNKLRMGDLHIVFWAQRSDTVLETSFAAAFGHPEADNPDRCVQAVHALFYAVRSGAFGADESTRFYVLGLTGNVSRIRVCFWLDGTATEIGENIIRHFEDMRMAPASPESSEYMPLAIWIARSVQNARKPAEAPPERYEGRTGENIPQALYTAVFNCILEGRPYPKTLQQACLLRIASDHEIDAARASLLKADLNRRHRFRHPTDEPPLSAALDPANGAPGYLAGRLFAVLEKLTEADRPDTGTAFRDRHLTLAFSVPSVLFSKLIAKSGPQLRKLPARKQTFFDKLIGEIVGRIGSDDLSGRLNDDDRARFAVGYYQQRTALLHSGDVHPSARTKEGDPPRQPGSRSVIRNVD